MPRVPFLLAAVLLCAANPSFAAGNSTTRLWYAQPAEKWTDALPIGNGRMGTMIFGGVFDERIQFNEDTLWKGQPHDYVRAGAGEQERRRASRYAGADDRDVVSSRLRHRVVPAPPTRPPARCLNGEAFTDRDRAL